MDREKLIVKPNLVSLSNFTDKKPSTVHTNKQVVYVGRLDIRKGIWTLLKAAEKTNISLILVGDGELRPDVERWLYERPHLDVRITGWVTRREVSENLEKASMLVLPSEFYESFGNVIVEAFAYGLPVITTNIGAQSELVDDGRTGTAH